jgi:DNA/RNA endonuclease YhcR with UshA esterase domain
MKSIAIILLGSSIAFAACKPITAARKYVGDSVCITGKVVKVARSPRSGTHFLNFCDDYKNCPFTVVIFAKDLQRVGDIRELEGKQIEIYGKVKEYKGQAEIILNDVRQLRGESAKLPKMPKDYDASNRGRYSAGKLNGASDPKPRTKKPARGPTVTEQPEDSQL